MNRLETILLNQIKDAIDRLAVIKSKRKRAEAARDLVEYIQLHHLDGAS